MQEKDPFQKLIMAVSAEIDYWLLEKNQEAREREFGRLATNMMKSRMEDLRGHLLSTLFVGYPAKDS